MQLFQMLDDSILSLPGYLIDANKRIFSIYLISAVLLAIPTYLMQKKQTSIGRFLGYLFNKKVWLHP